MTEVSTNEESIHSLQKQLDEAVKDTELLVYNFISDDIREWIEAGGCIKCNGAGHIYYWKDHQDTIVCPECDGKSPDYSLSYMFASCTPSSYYFPEIDQNLVSKRYPAEPYYGAKLSQKIVFWSSARLKKKDDLNKKVHFLRGELAKAKSALLEESRAKKSKETSAADVSKVELPSLYGVSKKQIGFGVACRKAAVDAKLATKDALSNNAESSYWIENYKHLLGR